MYDNELESIPEFNGFEDNIKKFTIYGFDQNNNKSTAVAVFKVSSTNFVKIMKLYCSKHIRQINIFL